MNIQKMIIDEFVSEKTKPRLMDVNELLTSTIASGDTTPNEPVKKAKSIINLFISRISKAATSMKKLFSRSDDDLREYYELEYRNEQSCDPWKNSEPMRWNF